MTLLAIKLPLMERMLLSWMLSVVPVAMAMLPEYDWQLARPVASELLWMVVVPPLPHWAARVCQYGGH